MSTQSPVASPAHKPNPVLKWIRANLIERTLQGIPRDDQVLDLCCGYGFYFSINKNAKGIDGDPACVKLLTGMGYDVLYGDVLAALPYPPGSFSSVIAHDVLEHFTVDQLKILIKNVHTVLKTGGRFYVFVPNKLGFDYGLKQDIGHKLYVTRKEVELIIPSLFSLAENYPEPLPRSIGRYFTHNKEVFILEKI